MQYEARNDRICESYERSHAHAGYPVIFGMARGLAVELAKTADMGFEPGRVVALANELIRTRGVNRLVRAQSKNSPMSC